MTAESRLLAGDIGATKTRMALFDGVRGDLRMVREKTYASGQYGVFDEIVADFLPGFKESIAAACFGVAGPVQGGRCRTTNLPWLIDEKDLECATGIARVRLLNDLQALAHGMLRLPEAELLELNPAAVPAVGNIAVVAAGTGCGEAILYWDGQVHHAIATEGGHADFASNSEEQDGLLRFLRGRFDGHVSYERVLSGPGLYNIYQYFRDQGVAPEAAEFHAALSAGEDPGRLIGGFALTRNDPLCCQTLRLFTRIYGAEAGNLALKSWAQGGVLIGGGIAPKILPVLREGDFLAGFVDKGRYAEWLGTLPVRVALNQDAGLLGAAHYAASLLS